MSEPVAVIASPPQRPPPPTRATSQGVGVVSPAHNQAPVRKDTREDILIVDSRSKSRSKSKPLFGDTDNGPSSPDSQTESRPRSNTLNSSFTLINSKRPDLQTTSPRSSIPPPRPGPPSRQKSVPNTVVNSVDECESVTPSQGSQDNEEDSLNEQEKRTSENEDSNKSVRSKPSRPPPPVRAKSLPRVKSLTTYKKVRDGRERSPTTGSAPPDLQESNNTQDVTLSLSPRTPSPVVTTALLVDIGEETDRNGTEECLLTQHSAGGHKKEKEVSTSEPNVPSKLEVKRRPSRSTPSPLSSPPRNFTSPEPSFTSNKTSVTADQKQETELISLDTTVTDSPPAIETNTDNLPTTISQPSVPPRPYLPPRPFPPRPSSGNKSQSAPLKPKRTRDHSRRSPHHPSRRVPNKPKQFELNELTPAVSHDPAAESHDPILASHDKITNNHAIMMSVEEPRSPFHFSVQDDTTVTRPSVSITDDGVQFGFPTDSLPPEKLSGDTPDYDKSLPATLTTTTVENKIHTEERDPTVVVSPKTLFELNQDDEKKDQISPLQPPLSPNSSPRFGRKKFINSMKKSFRSLRQSSRKPDSTDVILPRTQSDTSMMTSQDPGTYPDPLPQGIIDPLVVQSIAYLNRESVLVEQGLFRIPGDVAAIKKLRTSFVRGEDVDLYEVLDPHTVCGLLKLHFREKRVSIIPRGQPLTDLIQAVKQKNVTEVRSLINSNSVSHVATLRLVTELLMKVVSHSDENRMTSGTLATSCGPSIFPYLPPSNANQLVKFLVDHCEDIFSQ